MNVRGIHLEDVIVRGDGPHMCEQGLHSSYIAQAGTLLKLCLPFAIRVAAIRGKAQFLAPLICTSPFRGTPLR